MMEVERYGKEVAPITFGNMLFEKALEKYIEYLDKETEALDKDKKISQIKSQELYEDVPELREKSKKLHEDAKKLYEICNLHFQKAFKEYEKEPPSDKLFRSWGNSAYAWAIINKREAFYKEAKKYFEKAIDKYKDISNKDDVVLRRLGNAYYESAALDMDNSLYETAKKSFNEARNKYEEIALNKLNKDDYRNWGNALFELGRMKWRDFLILTENKNPSYKEFIKKEAHKIFEYSEDNKASHEKASEILSVEKIDKMMEIADGLFEEANKLYDKAIAEYKKMEGENYEDVFRSLGDIYSHRGRKYRYDYLTLIEKKEFLRKDAEKNNNEEKNKKAIEETEEKIRNVIDEAIENFELAIEQYKKAKEIYNKYNNKKEERYLLGVTHYRLFLTHYAKENQKTKEAKDEWKKAEDFFKSLKSSILDILVDLSMDVAYPMVNDNILFSLLDNKENEDTVFFENVVKQKKNVKREDKDKYKKIYIRSMYIINLLEVKNEHEQIVAHYTKKSIAQRMLLNDEKYWLYAINYFNDPKCGKILLDYLFPNNETKKNNEKTSNYVTFAGSFTFNYNSLNQFRLYGKEGEREGTGLSLVFNKTFFKEELKQDRAAYLKEFSQEFPKCFEENSVQLLERSFIKPRKNALFRCVYFDPETNRVETVGQKERYLFYREGKNKDEADKNKEEYITFINNVINDIDSELKELKNFVDEFKEEEEKSIIEQLIIKLRYLIKHVAFKEEQECRIVKIRQLGKDDDISISSHDKTLVSDLKMHFEYDLKVSQHVKEIYFGPKATMELEIFKICLKHKDLCDIECKESKNPLA